MLSIIICQHQYFHRVVKHCTEPDTSWLVSLTSKMHFDAGGFLATVFFPGQLSSFWIASNFSCVSQFCHLGIQTTEEHLIRHQCNTIFVSVSLPHTPTPQTNRISDKAPPNFVPAPHTLYTRLHRCPIQKSYFWYKICKNLDISFVFLLYFPNVKDVFSSHVLNTWSLISHHCLIYAT